MKLTELREKLEAKKAELKALIDGAKDVFTADEQKKAEAIEREIDTLKASIKHASNYDAIERETTTENPSPTPAPKLNLGAITREALSKYSLMRALRAKASGKDIDGVEREVSAEIARQSGKNPKGFYVPSQLLVERALDIGTNGTGFQQTMTSQTFIDVLRNNTLIDKLGVTFLTDMVGVFQIPRQTGPGTAYWVAEGSAPTGSAQTSDQVQFTPKTVGAYTDVTRQFVEQTSVSAEQFVRNDLTQVLALALDSAAFNGTGSSNQPKGVLADTNTTLISLGANGAALDFGDVVNFETQLSINNANAGAVAYVTNNAVRGKLKTTEVASGYPTMVWGSDPNTLNGYKALVSQQIPSNGTKGTSEGVCSSMVFGNWSDLVVAMWGTLDILVDPYTLSSSGGIRIVALQDADIQLRRPKSFVRCVDILTA